MHVVCIEQTGTASGPACNTGMTARLRPLVLGVGSAPRYPPGPARAAGPPLPSSSSGKAGAVAPGGRSAVTPRAGRDTVVVATRRGSRLSCAHDASPAAGASRRRRSTARRPGCRPTAARSCSSARRSTSRPRARASRSSTPAAFAVRRGSRSPASSRSTRSRPTAARRTSSSTATTSSTTACGPSTRAPAGSPRATSSTRAIPDEQMGGLPMTRAFSRDGRWAYTLYGGGAETFIHALDTVGRTAACIDLEMLPPDADLFARAAARQPRRAAHRRPRRRAPRGHRGHPHVRGQRARRGRGSPPPRPRHGRRSPRPRTAAAFPGRR